MTREAKIVRIGLIIMIIFTAGAFPVSLMCAIGRRPTDGLCDGVLSHRLTIFDFPLAGWWAIFTAIAVTGIAGIVMVTFWPRKDIEAEHKGRSS